MTEVNDMTNNKETKQAPAVEAGARDEREAVPQVLKGIGKINGDGWKDTTRKGEVVFVWNSELPRPYMAGQFPRIGCENWAASTEQYDFVPATVDEARAALARASEAAAGKPVSMDADERKVIAPVSIHRTHPNQAYVTLGFDSEDDCSDFLRVLNDLYTRKSRKRGAAVQPASEPVGKIVAFGSPDLKEVAWTTGKMPDVGTNLYGAPQAASAAPAEGWEAVRLQSDYDSLKKLCARAEAEAASAQVAIKKLREALATAPTMSEAVRDDMQAEIDRLNAIINTPHADDFLRAVSIEAEHQRQRWSSECDAGKTPADWFWLVGYLGGKALHAHTVGNVEKAEHHVITTAAACANWHRAMFGKTNMWPGIDGDAIKRIDREAVKEGP